ncbi:MAG: ATP synthase F1 subunit delta [Acidimicrobiales bacterium]
MRERIAGFADAIVDGAGRDGSLVGLCDGIEAVAHLVGLSPDLRAVMVDPGVPAHARRAVLAELFGGRIHPGALRAVTFAAEADRATDWADDLDWLGTRAAAARDGMRPVGSGPLGRHAAAERLDGYAGAVLGAVAERGQLGEVEDELFRYMQVVDGSAELRAALTGRDLPNDVRRSLATDLLSGKASDSTLAMATYAVGVGRSRDYLELLAGLVARVAEEGNRRVADVRAAVGLDDAQRRRLAEALGRLTGRPIEVRVAVDASVLGGFVATIGDTVVDGSVRHRLDVLKDRLTLPPSGPPPADTTETNLGETR